MGLEAYGVKLKNDKIWKTAFWDDLVEDFDENQIIPNENYFHKNTFNNRFYRFLKVEVFKDKNFDFYGGPCCSRENLNKVVDLLNEWVKNNPDIDYKDIETFIDYVDITSKKEIKDLLEYLTILNENECVMWFSD